jgi:glucosamine-phosphate N-acetyltransferase
MSEISLFENTLLSPEVQAQLPAGYTLRALRSNDYERGFLKVLEVLTEVGNHTKQEWLGK